MRQVLPRLIGSLWLLVLQRCMCFCLPAVSVGAMCRAAVVLLNIPLVIIGTRGYAVLSLFLVANLLTTCGLVPIILGLITSLRSFVTETGARGCSCRLGAVVFWVWRTYLGPGKWLAASSSPSGRAGVHPAPMLGEPRVGSTP